MENNIQQILDADDLPSPPGIAHRLLEMYSQEDVEIAEIAKVIGADPVLAAKLIDYCNSPILGRTRRTESIEQAVVAIGLRAVKMIGLSFSLMQTEPDESLGFDYQRFWNKSLATAIAARTISGHLRLDKDVAFLTGLVMNIGQMAMAHILGHEYLEILEQAETQDKPVTELEIEKCSFDHYEIGGAMLQNWKFPEEMSEVVRARSNNEKSGDQQQQILVVSEQIAEMLFVQEARAERIDAIKKVAEVQLGIESTEYDSLFDDSVAFWTEYAKLLDFDCSHAKTFKELESRARRSMAELSLGLQAQNAQMLEENSQLKANILIDPLTGLKNRRAYEAEAGAEFERCRRSRSSFVMMVIDIDRFKSINDSLGHAAGDKVLIRVAETLVDHVRKYDSVYRIGGEEFVIILADCPDEVAKSAAERFRKAVENLEVDIEGQIQKVTVSLGVRSCNASDESLEDVFNQADKLMYQAKTNGRNQCCFSITGGATPFPQSDTPLDLTSSLPRNQIS